jgi:DNA-directed RNA polymerase specialized sigma24 family protein
MGQPLGDVDDVLNSDAELIARVRAGSTADYADLVVRHARAAVRLAGEVFGEDAADAQVGEAFDHVLEVLRSGGGPDIAFRPYLLSVVRRMPTTEEPAPFEPGDAFAEHPAGRALASLPERWQLVLWHLDVEGEEPAAIAPLLGMRAEEIPELADQARDGLRQALHDPEAERGASLRTLLGPAVLGGSATAYLGGLPAPGAAAPANADRSGAAGPRTRSASSRQGTGALVAAAVGATLAAAALVAVVLSAHGPGEPGRGTAPQAGELRTQGPATPRGTITTDAVASANGVPTSAPTTAAALAGTSLGTPAAASSGTPSPHASRGGPAGARGERARTSMADVSVAARPSTTLPRSYVVRDTLRGVPAGRTTTLVVQGSQGMVLSSRDASCSGDGSSRLRCTVGGGVTRGSFSVLHLGAGTGRATLTIAPVAGFTDPARTNNVRTLTFS